MRKLSFIILFCVASQADARDRHGLAKYTKRYQSCSDRAQGSYTHILACQGEEVAVQDAKLNEAYSAVMRRLAPPNRKLLRNAERKWLTMRDKKCALPLADSGLSNLVDSQECRLEETLSRTGWLERYH